MTPETQLLDELESSLAKQLALAQSGDLTRLFELIKRTDELTGRLGHVAATAKGDGRIERISQLHRQLCLTLAQQKHELTDRLHRMRNGKDLLRTYRNARPR